MARAKGRTLGIAAAAALLALIGGAGARAQDDAAQIDCPLQAGPEATVARVIDGETVALVDGSEVRLLNVLTGDAPAGGTESAAAALGALLGGRDVQLFFEGEDDARQDRRGRWRAHLFVGEGPERVWAQARLVAQGLARVASFDDARACVRRLEALEEKARADSQGHWRAGGWAVVPAWQTRVLLARQNDFRIVDGRVAAVARTREWTFINFDADWRHDFTVAIAARDRRWFEGSDVDLDALEGARVRVRGWIERWNGPVIKATHPEQIEVLEKAVQPASAEAPAAQ